MQLDLKVYLKRALKPHQRALLSIQRDYLPTLLNDDSSDDQGTNASDSKGDQSKKKWSSRSVKKLVTSLVDYAPRSQFDRDLFLGALLRDDYSPSVKGVSDIQR